MFKKIWNIIVSAIKTAVNSLTYKEENNLDCYYSQSTENTEVVEPNQKLSFVKWMAGLYRSRESSLTEKVKAIRNKYRKFDIAIGALTIIGGFYFISVGSNIGCLCVVIMASVYRLVTSYKYMKATEAYIAA